MKKEEYQKLLDRDPFLTKTERASDIGFQGSKNITYIPIEAIRATLHEIYGEFYPEVRTTFKEANFLCTVVRINLTHPVTNKEFFIEGVSGSAFNMNKKNEFYVAHASAIQAPGKNFSNAIKNAVKNLGRVFGRDLADTDDFVIKVDNEIQKDRDFEEFDEKEYNTPVKLKEALQVFADNEKIVKVVKMRMMLLSSIFKSNKEVEKKCEESGFDFKESAIQLENLAKKKDEQ